MPQKTALLRRIPRVDALAAAQALSTYSDPARTNAVRAILEELRHAILRGDADEIPSEAQLCAAVHKRLQADMRPSLRRVINATGVVLHTNLGRACLPTEAVQAVCEASEGFSTLEYDPERGERGSRHAHVEALLCRLTGAEAAMAANNNAAAVLLALSALTSGREVVLSRGELVEIGGSFRIPDVMAQSGAILREVGTTNRTRLADYAAALGDLTGAILKVHPSNYRIVGFTESVDVRSLAALAHRQNLPLIEDLGGGALLPPASFGVPDQPCVPASVAAGVDLVCFSGDKLLGGPQAGLLVGKKELIERCRRHPLARALRVCKLTLAALEATLRLYLDPMQAVEQIPTLAMLHASPAALRAKAERLLAAIGTPQGAQIEAVEVQAQTGGGCAPEQPLVSWAVAVAPCEISVDLLEQRLRAAEPPIVARIYKNRLLLDLRTIFDCELESVATALHDALCDDRQEQTE